MAPLDFYVYDELPDKRDIRLLKLLTPTQPGDIIRCEMVRASLGHPQRSKYCALSYS
jgi:hypothetical protein